MDPKVKFGVADLHFLLISKLNTVLRTVKKDEVVDCLTSVTASAIWEYVVTTAIINDIIDSV